MPNPLTTARRLSALKTRGLEVPEAFRASTIATEAHLLGTPARERTAAMRRTLRRVGAHLRAMGAS
jgi:hypothetical protein